MRPDSSDARCRAADCRRIEAATQAGSRALDAFGDVRRLVRRRSDGAAGRGRARPVGLQQHRSVRAPLSSTCHACAARRRSSAGRSHAASASAPALHEARIVLEILHSGVQSRRVHVGVETATASFDLSSRAECSRRAKRRDRPWPARVARVLSPDFAPWCGATGLRQASSSSAAIDRLCSLLRQQLLADAQLRSQLGYLGVLLQVLAGAFPCPGRCVRRS